MSRALGTAALLGACLGAAPASATERRGPPSRAPALLVVTRPDRPGGTRIALPPDLSGWLRPLAARAGVAPGHARPLFERTLRCIVELFPYFDRLTLDAPAPAAGAAPGTRGVRALESRGALDAQLAWLPAADGVWLALQLERLALHGELMRTFRRPAGVRSHFTIDSRTDLNQRWPSTEALASAAGGVDGLIGATAHLLALHSRAGAPEDLVLRPGLVSQLRAEAQLPTAGGVRQRVALDLALAPAAGAPGSLPCYTDFLGAPRRLAADGRAHRGRDGAQIVAIMRPIGTP